MLTRDILQDIINRYDPMGLLRMGAPQDEYSPEINVFLGKDKEEPLMFCEIKKEDSLSEIQEKVIRCFKIMFDKLSNNVELQLKVIAKEIYDYLNK